MKNISKKAWFVPVIIGLIITLILVTFKYKDTWFQEDEGHKVPKATWSQATTIADEGMMNGADDFILIFGNDDCGACQSMYKILDDFYMDQDVNPTAGYLPVKTTDTSTDADAAQEFWNLHISGEVQWDWHNDVTGEDFTTSITTPVSLIFKDGVIARRVSGAPSGANEIRNTVKDIFNA